MSRNLRGPARRSRDKRPTDVWIAGRRAVTEAIRSGTAVEVLIAEGARRTQGMAELELEASRAALTVRSVDPVGVDELPVGPDHQGVAARVRLPRALGERDIATHPFGEADFVVVLDGITDPQNLGAAARCAEAAGAAMLVTRERRSAAVTPPAVRASAGALLHLPHARVANLPRALERLKDAGFTVIGLSETAPASIHDGPCPPGRVCLVIGSEGAGLSRLVREHCDMLLRLPMRGKVGSLNASAALAAVLYAYVLPSRGDPG